MICIYQYLFYLNYPQRPSLSDIYNSVFDGYNDAFAKKVFIDSIKNCNTAVIEITPFLQDWTFDRLSIIDQALLIMAYIENKNCNIEKAIVINVAVQLSKKFSAEDDTYKFINAVLDGLL